MGGPARILLVAALLLAGCTAQPVSAPPPSTNSPTSRPVPSFTNEPSDRGCPDVVPSDLVTGIVRTITHGARESREDGWVICLFSGGTWEIRFTVESDEESFGQRRERYLTSPGPGYTELPGFYDEAYEYYETLEGVRNLNLVVARRGSVEVSVRSGPYGSPDITAVRDELFAAIFERLG